MSFLSRMSLANRGLVALATIAILIFGALVIPTIKQELYPSLQFPAVSVITTYPGASPSIVEQDVTDPLEQSIQGMQNIQQVTSYSNQGSSIIVVQYNFGIDLNQEAQQITQQMNRVQGNLPSGVLTPQVQTFDVNSLPVIQLAVTANEDQAALAADLQKQVVPVLSSINGVAQVNVTGVRNQVVTITLDLAKMQADRITMTALQGALQANNVTLPAGQMTNNGQTYTISVGNTFNSLSDLQNLVVGEKTNCPQVSTSRTIPSAVPCKVAPTPVKLSDVATVAQTLAPSTSLTRTNGQPSLGISITQTSSGNTVSISQAVNQDITSLQNQLGHGAKITVVSDQAPSISSAVSGLVNEGLIGAGFAILVILLFLFSIRSTLVTAISIPLSIVIALIAIWAGGLTLNLFTLGGLTIAIGRVVDDSIVVLENIYRHLSLGEEKGVAIPAAVHEVAGAVTASTLTTVAVFLPVAFTGGLVGQVFGPFAITVTVALLASLFVALTIIPVLASWFLKAPRAKTGAKKAPRTAATPAVTAMSVFLPPLALAAGMGGTARNGHVVVIAAGVLVVLLLVLLIARALISRSRRASRTGAEVKKVENAPAANATAQDLHEKRTILERGYVLLVRWVTGHKAVSLIVAFVLFAGSIALVPRLGTNFFNPSQQNTYSITQTLPVGTSLDVTSKDAQQVENVLRNMPQIQHYQVTIGSTGTFGSLRGASGSSNVATFSLTTDPNADQTAFQQDVQNHLNTLTGIGTLQFSGSSSGLNSSSIAVNVQAQDQATLAQATQQVVQAVSGVSNVTNVSSNLVGASPLINVQVDPTKAALHGLTATQVGQLLREVYTGTTVTTVNFNGQQENVTLQLGTPATTVTDMENLLLPTPTGYVKLSDVATITQALGPTQITHIGGQRTATVSATATSNNVGGVTRAIARA